MSVKNNIKEIIKKKYGSIAAQTNDKAKSCCGPSCCGANKENEYKAFTDPDAYKRQQGYKPEADLGLGCGIPTELSEIKAGDTVIDLGSGAGNDVFISRSLVGDQGKVIGIDMTEEMIQKARANNDQFGYQNVEFHLADIENMPVIDNTADVVISNCVINLVPDKTLAFKEIYRVLKPGGHFCVSDIVIMGELPDYVQKSMELYAGCVSGALPKEEYLNIINKVGFEQVEIKKSKEIHISDELLAGFLTAEQITNLRKRDVGIFSITVSGYKKS